MADSVEVVKAMTATPVSSLSEVVGEFHYLNGEWWEHRGPYEQHDFLWIWIAGEWLEDQE